MVPNRKLKLSFCGLLFAALSAVPAAAEPLRYAWKQGEKHLFEVKIVVDTGDGTETFSGTPEYAVESADADAIRLRFTGSLLKTVQPKSRPGEFPRFPRPPLPFGDPTFGGVNSFGPRGQRTLSINERGKVIVEEGDSQLPYLLGDLAHLPLPPLPKGSEESWTLNKETTISIVDGGGGFRHPFFNRTGRDKSVKAEEEVTYRVEKRDGSQVAVKETSSLTSLEKVNGKPSMEMIGEATIVFDTKLGGPVSYAGKTTLTVREGNTTQEVPIQISVKRLGEAELAALKKARDDAAAKVKETLAAAEAEKRKPLDKDELTELVADLKSGDKPRYTKALERLKQKIPEKPNRDVSKALESYLTDADLGTRWSAAAALENWGGKDSAKAMLALLKDQDVIQRSAAVSMLGKYPSKESAEALAPLLEDVHCRIKAVEALKKMGEHAERPVIPLLESKDWVVQMEACKVLAETGSAKSLPALKPLASNSNGLVKMEAEKAVTAIKRRSEK